MTSILWTYSWLYLCSAFHFFVNTLKIISQRNNDLLSVLYIESDTVAIVRKKKEEFMHSVKIYRHFIG